MPIDEAPSEVPLQHTYDFSNLQGLQLVGAHPGASEDASEAWREALKLELATRAARFHHAVDASILLSDDGVIRWLGDPIARLAAGPDLLTPRALVLADPSLPESARETVGARLELWLAATIRRLLGPLLELRGLQDECEPVRQLAAKIADSLGVLEREPLRSQIKALDQNSRAALRRRGVRFGAYYVYVPQSLKPASRALALQMWRVRAPDADDEEHAKTLLPLAASGRTSLPVNPLISREGYRVAGFRPSGERAVRVDIVERLSDMIRAAFGVCSSSDGSRPAGSAFLVSGQMTSLTGCSGEAFASILRSLGYESFEIERSRLASPQPVETITVETITVETPEAATVETIAAQAVEAPTVETVAAEAATADTKVVAETLENGVVPSIGGESADLVADPVPDPGAEPPSWALSDTSEETDRAMAAPHSSAEPSEPETCAPEATNPPSDGASSLAATVIAWRPVRRQRSEQAKRRLRRGEATPKGVNRRSESRGVEARADSGERRGKGKGNSAGASLDAHEKASSPQRKQERFDGVDQKRRKTSAKQNVQGAPQFESRRTVDPTSPFAKLLELRIVLEKQGNNR
jgi:ATP-dependent RNA helicase SUPV3L1/SUV3